MNEDEVIFDCPACGAWWRKGQDGRHDCVPRLVEKVAALEAQLAEARKTALELELHAANQGSTPSVKWTGEDGRVRSLLTSTPMETRAALMAARDAALEEAAKEVEPIAENAYHYEARAALVDAAAAIRGLKSKSEGM